MEIPVLYTWCYIIATQVQSVHSSHGILRRLLELEALSGHEELVLILAREKKKSGYTGIGQNCLGSNNNNYHLPCAYPVCRTKSFIGVTLILAELDAIAHLILTDKEMKRN